LQTRPGLDEEHFFAGDDPFLSRDPRIRVKLAQLAHAYESALLAGNRALANKLSKEAYQLRARETFGEN
jgi:hypothetical protein